MTTHDLEVLAEYGQAKPDTWRLPDFLWRIGRIGTEGYPPRVARRLAVTNVIAAMVSVMTIPYLVLYAIYDFAELWPAIVAFSPQVVLFALTPFLHRHGPIAAASYLCVVWLVFCVGYCFFFGRDSGLHFYFLPGAAASMLIFGSERLLLSAAVTLTAFAGFMLTQIFFTSPAWFLTVDPFFNQILFFVTVPFAFLLIFTTVFFAFKEAAQAELGLEREYRFSERLLENILPKAVAARLKDRQNVIVADQVEAATILFADIVNFTPRASRWPPQEVVLFLSRVFRGFDELAARYGLEKIKTIGDAYMVAGGLPEPRADHAQAIAAMALDMLDHCRHLSREIGEEVEVRIGIGSGPVIAGVIGSTKLLYDVWGDTVNTAARMESHGVAGRIQVSESVKTLLQDCFEFELRGDIDVKGKGVMTVWFLNGKRP